MVVKSLRLGSFACLRSYVRAESERPEVSLAPNTGEECTPRARARRRAATTKSAVGPGKGASPKPAIESARSRSDER